VPLMGTESFLYLPLAHRLALPYPP
jgi:hypothetical protein